MSADDQNEGGPGECPGHEWDLADLHATNATTSAGIGFGLSYECRWCGATRYEPSNYEKFPDTQGLNPKLYPREVAALRRFRGW